MKKGKTLAVAIAGVLTGALLVGPGVQAASEIINAVKSPQTIYVDKTAVEMEAYNINNYNYVKVRDLGSAVGFGVSYDDATNTVQIDSTGNSDPETIYHSTQQVLNPGDVTAENSKDLRIAAMNAINAVPAENLEDQIRQRLYTWWGNWKPDYEGWLECANDLYAEDAIIYAIGGEQKFSDYKVSMKDQRDACEMEMGPIMQMTVDGNTATLVYNMYLTPKGTDYTMSMMITEYNTFEEIDGKLMVTRLDLYTDGGAMGAMG